jgi:pimeloyl-ACP methyl ester carboxylesterase
MSTEPACEPAGIGSEGNLGRRALLTGAASVAATGLAASLPVPARAVQDASETTPATFVLVPGQWTGAFIWHLVTPLLRAAGHEVYEVTCTGLGDRVHLASPTIDMDTHITDVVNTIEFADLHDVVLVGHSYSGMIITGVAERVPERLRMLVYLDASVPSDGQNSYDADFIDEGAKLEAIAADITGGMEAGMPGFRPVSPEIEEWVREMVADPAEADWFIPRLVPHPLLSDQQPVKLGNPLAAALPRAFILCTADKDLQADPQMDPYVLHVERVRSDPQWRVIELDNNHVVNLNDPEGTVEAFLSLL